MRCMRTSKTCGITLATAVGVCESSSLRVMSRTGIAGTNQSLLALTAVNREILVSFNKLLHMLPVFSCHFGLSQGPLSQCLIFIKGS